MESEKYLLNSSCETPNCLASKFFIKFIELSACIILYPIPPKISFSFKKNLLKLVLKIILFGLTEIIQYIIKGSKSPASICD